LKLELAVDGDKTPWLPDAEAETRLRRLIAGFGPPDGILEVVLTDDQVIRQLNRDYRNKDRPTDVLSFSYLEGHEEHRQDLLQGRRKAREFNQESPEDQIVVGQVLISVETMQKRDIRRDHDDNEEFQFLAIHGMLHTLGYDHINAEDAKEMEDAQDTILKAPREEPLGGSEGGASR